MNQIAFMGLASEKDYEETAAFFKVSEQSCADVSAPLTYNSLQDKDTSKFDMALNQTLDSIKSRAAWVKVSHLLTLETRYEILTTTAQRSNDELTKWLEQRESKL